VISFLFAKFARLPVIESHDVDVIPDRTHDAVIRRFAKENLVRRRRFGRKLQCPFVTNDFHFGTECLQSRADAFVLFSDSRDRSIDGALPDQILKFFINAQAQHLFTSTGKVPLAEIEQDNVEQGFKFKRGV
jgi:hypothetical protein